jgi:hypothetical protein
MTTGRAGRAGWASRAEGSGAAAALADDRRPAIGPKVVAFAVLGVCACAVLAVHLATRVAPRSVHAPAAPAAPLQEDAAPPSGEPGPVPPAQEAGPGPIAVGSVAWERALNECVERNVHGSGYDDLKPTAPGRWPALKRAREERRLRRLAVRAECEKELTP